ncbi:MAG: glycosyltransferase family 2 protein [Lachnospiraceae bacterium]|nr:glycosyltransferase family 2 protein [Lachnospiraceae bacterium]
MRKFDRHTFVICAYGESPYLEDCIISLMGQSVESNVIMATSTPNDLIRDLCGKYGLDLFVNDGPGSITLDWNFAISCAGTDIVTIAHQDDVYYSDYTEGLIRSLKGAKRPIIYFSDYDEIRKGERVASNKLLKIKRCMLLPLRIGALQKSRWVRRRIISLGSPICCPAVTYFLENTGQPVFRDHFRTDEDWEAWEKLSRLKGEFLYDPAHRMGHRIHGGSETSKVIGETGRSAEDLEMYRKFWPEPIARLLCRAYAKSEESNKV